MQQTGAADSFRRRPDEHERVIVPSMLVARVTKPAVKIENWFAVLPDGNGGAQVAEFLEVLAKKRLQSLAECVGVQHHRRNGRDAALLKEPIYYYNMGCYEALLGNVKDARVNLETSFEMDETFRELAKKDPDLKTVQPLL